MEEESIFRFDFSGAEALLRLVKCDPDVLQPCLEELISSEGYRHYLERHQNDVSEEILRSALIGLKTNAKLNEPRFTNMALPFQRPGDFEKAVNHFKENQEDIIGNITTAIFPWLPFLYRKKTTVFFIVDGIFPGYPVRNNWICDLYPSLLSGDEDYHFTYAQLYSMFVANELNSHFREFWYEYAEKVSDNLDIYKLYVVIELLKNGYPLFLRNQLGIRLAGNELSIGETSIEEIGLMHDRLRKFVSQIPLEPDPRGYFNRNITQFYMGKTSLFQALGSFIFTRVMKCHDRKTLIEGISNPIRLYELFIETFANDSGARLFTSILLDGHRTDEDQVSIEEKSFAGPVIEEAKCGSRIISFENGGNLRFCILIKGGGANSDGEKQIGLAHLCEHYFVRLIQQSVTELAFLKGLTDRENCMYLGTVRGGGSRALPLILKRLQQPTNINQELLNVSKADVLNEIGKVSVNPFYLTEKGLCRLMIPDAHPIRGEEDNIENINADLIAGYQRCHHIPEKFVISISGTDTNAASVELVEFLNNCRSDGARDPDKRNPITRGSEGRVRWEPTDNIITTCSIGFFCNRLPVADVLSEYLVRQLLEKQIAKCSARYFPDRKITSFVEFRKFGEVHLIIINYQGFSEDLIGLAHEAMKSIAGWDIEEQTAILGKIYNNQVIRLLDVWRQDKQELCMAAVRECADNSAFFLNPTVPDSPRTGDLITLLDILRKSLYIESAYIYGIGPKELNPAYL